MYEVNQGIHFLEPNKLKKRREEGSCDNECFTWMKGRDPNPASMDLIFSVKKDTSERSVNSPLIKGITSQDQTITDINGGISHYYWI